MKRETLITAWARPAMGPGWSNTPIWYLVKVDDEHGSHLEERCLQPDQQNKKLAILYPIAATVDNVLMDAVRDQITLLKED